MNKIKLIIFAFAAIMFTSCDDAVDITQPGRFSADAAFQTTDDLRLGLLGAYNNMDITNVIRFNAVFTDELSIGFDNGGQNVGLYGHILNSTSGTASSVWNRSYDAINSTTRLIEASALITPEEADRDLFNDILGQAHAIRAWAHFMLFTYYTTDYTNDSAPCVIAVDFVPELTAELGRNTVAEVLNLINSDLSQADNLLAAGAADPTFINRDFVKAIRARIALYRQDYSTADALAAELISDYPLANQLAYINMFHNDNDNTEVIFKLERAIGDSYDNQATGGGGWAGSLFAFVDPSLSGSPFMEMGRTLFNLMDEADVRRATNIHPTSIIDPNYATNPNFRDDDILVIQKYPGSEGQPLMNDIKMFRSSEMVLIRAEAAAASGDLAGAANFIKVLRDARFGGGQPTPSFGSQEEAFKGVLDERRVELCFEGHRWVDLKRLGIRAGASIELTIQRISINRST
ncbi:MAG: RagB/SusD family nutrient uptake outer membrane protein, partial [Bacteroidota bacterium]